MRRESLAATDQGDRPARRRVGRPALFDRATVIEATAAIIEKEGVEAVTMRRVAEEVGAGLSSLYWHFTDKQDLLLGVIDASISKVSRTKISRGPTIGGAVGDGDGWEERVTGLALDLFDVLCAAAPVAASVGAASLMTSPGMLSVSDELLGLLAERELPPAETALVFGALLDLVLGAALRWHDPPDGRDGDPRWRRRREAAAELLGQLPHLQAAGDELTRAGGADELEPRVALLLRGVAGGS
ncbi:MAG: TetR/AcrR family transcriptional regulator [Acidimicrobiales bacterium]